MNKNILDQEQKEQKSLMKVVLVGVNASFNHTNLAIRQLKYYCRQNTDIRENVDFICREYTINDSVRENMDCLLQENAGIYGFSCYIWNITVILEMTEILKKLRPECVIVLGGPEVSFEQEEFFSFHPEIDYIIRGSGEKALSDLLLSFLVNQHLDLISNVPLSLQTRLIDGESVPLNEIPFAYEPEDFMLKQKQYYYETTRGCPFACSYCLSSTIKEIDVLSMERVKSELTFFIQQKIKQVKLVDRTFNFNDRRAMEIWRFLMEKYNQKPFQTNFHFELAGDLLTQESIALLGKAPKGLFQFEIGVQTTNRIVLGNIHRKSSLSKMYENVKKLKELENIPLHLDLIAGLPGEDWSSFAKSFHDVLSLRPDMLQLGFLKVLKGSPIREDAARLGLVYLDRPPYEIIATASMSFHELNRLKNIEDLLERYYNSFLFRYSLEFILGIFPDSFDLFTKMEKEWGKKGLFKRNLSRQEIIREFYFFGRMVLDGRMVFDEPSRQEPKEDFNLFCDLLKFDYYRFDKKGNIEELEINFSHHHPSLPRNLEKDSWYRPNGQPVCLKPRLERYRFDVSQLIGSGRVVPILSYVLYEMSGDRPTIIDVLVIEENHHI